MLFSTKAKKLFNTEGAVGNLVFSDTQRSQTTLIRREYIVKDAVDNFYFQPTLKNLHCADKARFHLPFPTETKYIMYLVKGAPINTEL